MPHPTQKRTKSYKRKRAVHYRLKKVKLFKCPKCKKSVLAHQACSFCGSYAGRQALKIKTKKGSKKEKK